MERREFLKSAGLGAAALGIAACAPGKAVEEEQGSNVLEGTMPQHYAGVGLLGFGAMRWPMVKNEEGKDVIDQEKVNEMVDLALQHGVNYFDSAPVYLQGQSEEATAKALLRYPRDSYFIATKCSNQRAPYNFEDGKAMYQKSLEYYQTDYIDYYLLHSVGNGKALKDRFIDTGLLDYFLAEREAGHIRNLGFSFHGQLQGMQELLELHPKYHWDFIQIQMNYVDWTHASGRNANAKDLYEAIDALGIPIVIMEPLRGGRLADLPAGLADQLKARKPSGSLASWAFQFAGSYPRILTVLSGMTRLEHLQDNLDTFLDFEELDDEGKDFLDSIADQMLKYPLVGCTGCQYCMPCPYGIDIPGIFKFYNDNVNAATYVVSKEQEDYARARRKYLLGYNKAVESIRQADHCIACNRCVSACPQHIRIPSELRRIDNYVEQLKQETL